MTHKEAEIIRAKLDVQRQATKVKEAKVNLDEGYKKLQADLEKEYTKLKLEYEREVLHLTREETYVKELEANDFNKHGDMES